LTSRVVVLGWLSRVTFGAHCPRVGARCHVERGIDPLGRGSVKWRLHARVSPLTFNRRHRGWLAEVTRGATLPTGRCPVPRKSRFAKHEQVSDVICFAADLGPRVSSATCCDPTRAGQGQAAKRK